MEKLLTVAEAAPLVNMSRQGLYAAIRAQQFPALHIGRRIRIPQSSVQRWIAEQTQLLTMSSRADEEPPQEDGVTTARPLHRLFPNK